MEYIRTLSKELDVGDRCELRVETRSGTTTVRGEDGSRRVRIEIVARIWADDDREADEQADLIAGAIEQRGGRVTVRAPTLLWPRHFLILSRGPRIDYQITVPRDTTADLESRSARLEVESIAGPLDVEARSGRVLLRDIAKDVRIVERSGAVQAESIGGTLSVEARSGSVRVRGCRKDVQIRTASGLVQAEDAGAGLRVQARSGAVRYAGPVRGDFDIEVTSGSVRLAVPHDAVFYLDAETIAGAVRSDLPVRDGAEGPPSGGPKVRIRTVSGSIHLTPR